MPTKNKKQARENISGAFRRGAADIDRNYGATIFKGICGFVRTGILHVGHRVRAHNDGAAAEKEAANEYSAGERTSWKAFVTSNDARKADTTALRAEIVKFNNSALQLQAAPLVRKTGANIVLSDVTNDLRFAVQRIDHAVEYYNDIVKEISATISPEDADNSALITKKIYVQFAGFETRTDAILYEVCGTLGACRDQLADAIDLNRMKVVAYNMEDDEVDRSIAVYQTVMGNLQGGAGIVALVTPEETVAQAFEAATGLGQIVLNLIDSGLEDWNLKRKAKAIMADTDLKRQAEDYLARNPRKVLDYLRDQNKKSLERALDMTQPAVSGVLMGASIGLDMTGVGAVVAKVVFPWIFPTVKTTIVTLFTSLDDAAIRQAFPPGRTLVVSAEGLKACYQEVVDQLAAQKDTVTSSVLRDIKAKDPLQQVMEETEKEVEAEETRLAMKKEPTRAGRARERIGEKMREGLGNLTPDGLVKAIGEAVSPVVTRMIGAVGDATPTHFDDATLLTAASDMRGRSSVEQSYAART